MNRRNKVLVTGAALAAAVLGGTGVATAGAGDDDGEAAISGEAYDRAAAAALAATDGGRVSGTEVGDEESYYEVEVTLDDGSQVDVQLDEAFAVVGSDPDSETEPDD